MSYNVHGLAARESRLQLKSILSDIHPPCQTLCVWEHKLRARSINLLRMEIWNVIQFFTAPTRDGAHAPKNDVVPTGVGGTFIAINPRLAAHVTQHGTIL